jgi:hypothetical protein
MAQTTRLNLPTSDYIGSRAPGTIKTIDAGVFTTADNRLMQSGAGSPVGSVESHWAGQRYLDTTNLRVWFNPLAEDSYNWVQLQNGELMSLANAAVFHGEEAVTAP